MAADESLNTVQMHNWVDRMRAGDTSAASELIRKVGRRLERLAKKMLRGFPNVARWAEFDDVLQGAVIRLLASLETIRPASTRDFYNLAAVHLRRELIDLARRFHGAHGIAANHESVAGDSSIGNAVLEGVAPSGDVGDLDRCTAFHAAVERLPAEEREVVGLAFYHGWDDVRAAELLGVSDRTVRRWWKSACRRLREELGEDFPNPE